MECIRSPRGGDRGSMECIRSPRGREVPWSALGVGRFHGVHYRCGEVPWSALGVGRLHGVH